VKISLIHDTSPEISSSIKSAAPEERKSTGCTKYARANRTFDIDQLRLPRCFLTRYQPPAVLSYEHANVYCGITVGRRPDYRAGAAKFAFSDAFVPDSACGELVQRKDASGKIAGYQEKPPSRMDPAASPDCRARNTIRPYAQYLLERFFCALSGRAIVRGDEVFRPRRSMTLVPANWRRMILASDVIATFASTQLDRAAA
jgi:hypothetical protein